MLRESKTIPVTVLAVHESAWRRSGAASLARDPKVLKVLSEDPVQYVVMKCSENENNYVSTLKKLMKNSDVSISLGAATAMNRKMGLIDNALNRYGASKSRLQELDNEKELWFTHRT